MGRRLTRGMIDFISLVPKGANRLPVIYKSDGVFEFSTLLKADDFEEKGELLAVVYAPELRDSQGDIASAEVIRTMAHDFQKSGGQIDIRHDGKPVTKDQAYVAENFIIQNGDPRFDGMKDYSGNKVDVTGAWGVLIKIDDDNLRAQYRQGKWDGVSMGGHAEVEADKQEFNFAEFMHHFKQLGEISEKGDLEMTAEELKKALEESNVSLVAALKEALKPEEKKDELVKKEPEKNPAPEFKGDPLKKVDLEKHEKALALWSLKKDTDFSDPEQVKVLIEASKEESDDDDDDDENKEEVDRLKKQIAKLQGKSRAGEGGNKRSDTEEQAESGSRMAGMVNKSWGTQDVSGVKALAKAILAG